MGGENSETDHQFRSDEVACQKIVEGHLGESDNMNNREATSKRKKRTIGKQLRRETNIKEQKQ